MASSQPAYNNHSPVSSEAEAETSGNVLKVPDVPSNYITIGKSRVHINDVEAAFGGTLNPGLHAPPSRKFANPSPLGLCGFALTLFCLGIFTAEGLGVNKPNAMIGVAVFYGGLTQLCAAMWEIVVENTFGAVVHGSYGAFWMSFAALHIPWFGIQAAFIDEDGVFDGDMFMNSAGFFFLAWCVFTLGMTLCTLKSTIALFSMFFLLAVTFLLLAIGNFSPSHNTVRAGGGLGVVVAVIAWYIAYAGIANEQNSYLTVRPFYLPGGGPPKPKPKEF